MTTSSDIADFRRLEAEIDGQIITHKGYRSNPRTRERRVRYEEKWRRGQFLGHGAYGTVLLEENVEDKEKLRAVKILTKNRNASGDVDPFDEAVTMSVLSRPENEAFFVNFYGWYETYDTLCLVMEYIEHGDLDKHLYKHGPLREIDATIVVKQLLEGLEVIHQAGFIHGDLKPNNILIQHLSPWWVKIADFGISRRLKDRTALTCTGRGTTGYKAPEISFNERTRHTTAVDMWSLGCITFKSLTNEIPFKNDREVACFCKDENSIFTQLDTIKYVTNEAKAFLGKLVVTDPLGRAKAKSALLLDWIVKPPPFSFQFTKSHGGFKTPTCFYYVDKGKRTSRWYPISKVKGKDRKAALLLFDQGMTVDANSVIERNLMEGTVMEARIDIVQTMLDRGADIDREYCFGHTLLSLAASKGSKAMVTFLLDKGANTESSGPNSPIPLLEAAEKGYEEIVQTLLQKGANIDVQDIFRRTALLLAVRGSHEAVVNILLNWGADISVSGFGPMTRTAYEIANDKGNERIQSMLQQRMMLISSSSTTLTPQPSRPTLQLPSRPSMPSELFKD